MIPNSFSPIYCTYQWTIESHMLTSRIQLLISALETMSTTFPWRFCHFWCSYSLTIKFLFSLDTGGDRRYLVAIQGLAVLINSTEFPAPSQGITRSPIFAASLTDTVFYASTIIYVIIQDRPKSAFAFSTAILSSIFTLTAVNSTTSL